MQVAKRHRRGSFVSQCLALGVAAMVVLVQLLALHHEAAVAHAQVARTGAIVHAQALGEHHELSTTSHLHSTEPAPHEDNGACTLLSALDHGTVVPQAFQLFATLVPPARLITAQPAAPPAGSFPLLAVAPKTSPPALT